MRVSFEWLNTWEVLMNVMEILCVCVCVSMEGLQTSLRFALMNTASVTRTMGTCCNLPAVCVGGGAAAPLKPVTGVCETTTDNNGPPLVQVRLNDRELSRALLKRYSESLRICVNTTNVSTLNGCLCVAQVCKSKGQRRIGVALGFVD